VRVACPCPDGRYSMNPVTRYQLSICVPFVGRPDAGFDDEFVSRRRAEEEAGNRIQRPKGRRSVSLDVIP
jgi:hypothetical protein